MDNFDKFLNKAKDLAQVAIDKTGELVETGKAKVNIKQAQYDIKKIYEKIGRAYYEGIKSGSDNTEDINGFIDAIDALKEKISELEASMSDDDKKETNKPNDAVCASCGASVSDGDVYCPKCGNKL